MGQTTALIAMCAGICRWGQRHTLIAARSPRVQVLLGGAEGDQGFGNTEEIERNAIAAGPPGSPPNTIVRSVVTLPEGKTCDYCTLQWIWAAENDGGSYVACVDISITDNGQLPDFANIPSEVGNILPGVPPSPLPPDSPAPQLEVT